MTAFPTLLLRAGFRYQIRHRWQALLALTGIVLGVAVVLAVDLANSGARAAFEQAARQVQGEATHRLVLAGGTLPDSAYVGLKRLPGAPPMAPVVTDWVRVAGHEGSYRLLGVDLFAEAAFRDQLAGLTVGTGQVRDWLTRPDALLLGQGTALRFGLADGDMVQITHRGRPASLRVLLVDSGHSSALSDLLLVDIATAKRVLSMEGQLSHVDLLLDTDGIRWVRERLPENLQLLSVSEQVQGIGRMSAAFELNLTAMSLLALLVGMFLIFNAMSFSMVQRRRLFGRLRAVGVTPRELLAVIMLEALLLALVGTVLGLLLGLWLGQGLVRLVAATVSELYYTVSVGALQPDWRSLLVAGSLGVAATLLATLFPAWHAAGTPPLTTLSRAALEQAARSGIPRWALLGALTLVAGLMLALVLPGGVLLSFAGLFLLVLGAALMTPLMLRGLHRLLAWLALPGVWRMGVRDLDRHLSRLSIAVAALMVALSASVGVGVMVDSMRGAVGSWLADLLRADLYVAAVAYEDDARLPPQLVDTVCTLEAVAACSRYRPRSLPLAGRRVELVGAGLAPRSRPGFEMLRAAPQAWQRFERGEVLLSEPLASRLRLEPGDSLSLPTPVGPVALVIAGIFRDYASEHGRIFMDERYYLRYWPDSRVKTLALFARAGRADRLRAKLGELAETEPITIIPSGEILAESMAIFDRTFRITDVLRVLSLGVAFIGVLSALMALQLERGKEYAVLRALGLTRGQIAGLISGESLLVGLLAALAAVPTGLLMAWVLIESVQYRAFGWTMPLDIDSVLLLQAVLLGLLASGLAAIYPAWRSAHRDPAPQLRED